MKTLSRVLRTMTLAGYDVNVWQCVLSVLRPYALPAWADKTTLFMVQTLWEQARITIGEVARQNYGYRHFQERQYNQAFNAIGRMLITTFDVNGLLAIITREFPKLGIPSCGGRYSSKSTNGRRNCLRGRCNRCNGKRRLSRPAAATAHDSSEHVDQVKTESSRSSLTDRLKQLAEKLKL